MPRSSKQRTLGHGNAWPQRTLTGRRDAATRIGRPGPQLSVVVAKTAQKRSAVLEAAARETDAMRSPCRRERPERPFCCRLQRDVVEIGGGVSNIGVGPAARTRIGGRRKPPARRDRHSPKACNPCYLFEFRGFPSAGTDDNARTDCDMESKPGEVDAMPATARTEAVNRGKFNECPGSGSLGLFSGQQTGVSNRKIVGALRPVSGQTLPPSAGMAPLG